MKKRVRALIIKNNQMLLIHRVKGKQEYWVFPGGGVEESDSTHEQCLERECLEELNVVVSVGNMFTERTMGSGSDTQVEYFYFCNIISGEIGSAKGPEANRDPKISGTYENVWMSLSDFPNKNIQPTEIRDKIVARFQ